MSMRQLIKPHRMRMNICGVPEVLERRGVPGAMRRRGAQFKEQQ
jgi:hypothetical protein